MTEIQYSILEKKEVVEDSVIEKRGGVVKFSLSELDQNQMVLFRLQKELTKQAEVEDAKITNIETHHPFVKDMSDLDVSTVHIYYEAKTLGKACKAKLIEVNSAIDEQMADRAEILKQLPELVAGIKTPYVDEVKK